MPDNDDTKRGRRADNPSSSRPAPQRERPKPRIFDDAGNEIQAQRTSYSGRTTDEGLTTSRQGDRRDDGRQAASGQIQGRKHRPGNAEPKGRSTSGGKSAYPARAGSLRDGPRREDASDFARLEGPRGFESARPRAAPKPRPKPAAAGKPAFGKKARPELEERPTPPVRRDDGSKKYVYRDSDAPDAGRSGAKGIDRIAKVMARAGLCSRRDAEGWILEGRVSVNGRIIESPALDVSPADKIIVDGKPLPTRERTRLWLFHKPAGLVTTESDPEGRPTVFDNLPEGLPRVVSIGRLDINTEGLLLLTNDGGLARVLAHPTTGWLRRYRVRINGKVDPNMFEELRLGVTVDGVHYEPIIASLDRSKGANSWMTLDLTEGKNREVKRVLEHYGLLVTRLIRISFGPFQLGELAEGAAEEIKSRTLQDQLGARLADEAEVDFEAPRFEHAENEEQQQLRPRKRYDPRKPSEKRGMIARGEVLGFEVKEESFSTRKGRVVTVERIKPKAPSAESLGDGKVLWRRGMTIDSEIGPSRVSVRREDGAPYREKRAPRATDGERGSRTARTPDDKPNGKRGFAKARDSDLGDSKAYSGRSTSGKSATGKPSFGKGASGNGKPAFGKSASGRPSGGRTFSGGKPASGRTGSGRPSGGRPGGKSRPS